MLTNGARKRNSGTTGILVPRGQAQRTRVHTLKGREDEWIANPLQQRRGKVRLFEIEVSKLHLVAQSVRRRSNDLARVGGSHSRPQRTKRHMCVGEFELN